MNQRMTPEERKALEQRAASATRRGELADAFEALKQLASAFPDEPGFQNRLAELQSTLQPSELMNPKARAPLEKRAPSSLTDQAELFAAQGQYAMAISIYRQLLAQQPEGELIKERLAELFQLAQASDPRPSAPRPQTPVDPKTALEDLLERIGTRKRR